MIHIGEHAIRAHAERLTPNVLGALADAGLTVTDLNAVVVGQILGGEEASFSRVAQAVGPFVLIATIYSNLAVTVKRLHDVGYSGFLSVAMFVPFLNFLFTIWVGILPGTAGPNQYGDVTDTVPA